MACWKWHAGINPAWCQNQINFGLESAKSTLSDKSVRLSLNYLQLLAWHTWDGLASCVIVVVRKSAGHWLTLTNRLPFVWCQIGPTWRQISMTLRLLLPGFNFSLMMCPGFIPKSFMCLSSISCASHLWHALSKASLCCVTHGCCCANFVCKPPAKTKSPRLRAAPRPLPCSRSRFPWTLRHIDEDYWPSSRYYNTSAYIWGAELQEKLSRFSLACDPCRRVPGHSCRSRSLHYPSRFSRHNTVRYP